MRATSLVMTILLKKHSRTITADSVRVPLAPFSRDCPSLENSPRAWAPATMIIRQNSSAMVR